CLHYEVLTNEELDRLLNPFQMTQLKNRDQVDLQLK
ncbi:hypothetical protein, partial [Sporosarcina sp. NCCP-2222]